MTVPACLGETATATPGWPGSGGCRRNAIVGIDLADHKQAAVVTDHDSRVIARRRVTARAWELGELLDWALGKAIAAGFASVTRADRAPVAGAGSSSPRSGAWRWCACSRCWSTALVRART